VLPTSDAGARHSSPASNQPPEDVLNNNLSGVAMPLFRGYRCLSVLQCMLPRHQCALIRVRVRKSCISNNFARIRLQAPTKCKILYPDKILIISVNEKEKNLSKCRWLHSLLKMAIRYRKCPQPPMFILKNTTLRLPALDHQWHSERRFLRN